ncbi:MAG: hypothetical protein U9M89_02795 [Patescibacteria group bacterium]|nr:hypothetical protein [Patescibacteria group bacterium]
MNRLEADEADGTKRKSDDNSEPTDNETSELFEGEPSIDSCRMVEPDVASLDDEADKLHLLIDDLADLIFDLYDLTLNMRLRGRYIAKEIKAVHTKIEDACRETNGINLSSFPKLERCVKKIKKS